LVSSLFMNTPISAVLLFTASLFPHTHTDFNIRLFYCIFIGVFNYKY
jgi:hypothetical protein